MPERRLVSAIGRFLVGLLAASGLWLLALGTQRWHTEAAVKQVVDRFVSAVLRGDRTAALEWIDEVERRPGNGTAAENDWEPTPGFLYRIVRIRIDGDRATAHVRLKQSDLYAEPVVRLRYRNGRWRITSIERYRFYAFHARKAEQRARHSGEELADELVRAFEAAGADRTASVAPARPVR